MVRNQNQTTSKITQKIMTIGKNTESTVGLAK